MYKLAIILSLLIFSSTDATAKQVALVVGISKYVAVGNLDNPNRDAGVIADRLRDLNFDVTESFDADGFALNRAVDQFIRKAAGADLAVFYFAGHGIQLFDRNVLLARDANAETAITIGELGVDLTEFVNRLRAAAPVRIALMIDACRYNPFSFDKTVEIVRRIGGSRDASNEEITRSASSNGLAQVSLEDRSSDAAELLYLFAAQPGKVSFDGDGKNSFFVEGIREALSKPDRSIWKVFQQASAYVRIVTEGQQVPQLVTDWTGDMVLGQTLKTKVRYLNYASAKAGKDLTATELAFIGRANRSWQFLYGDFIAHESQAFSGDVVVADESAQAKANKLGNVNGFAIDHDLDRDGRDETIAAYVMQTAVVIEIVDEGVSLLDRTCLPDNGPQKVEIALRDLNNDRRPEVFLHFDSDRGGWGTFCVLEYVGSSRAVDLRRKNGFREWAEKSPFRVLLYHPGSGSVTIGNDNSIETCAGSNCHTRSAWKFDGRFFTRILDQSEQTSAAQAQPFTDQSDYEQRVTALNKGFLPEDAMEFSRIRRFINDTYLPDGQDGYTETEYATVVDYWGKRTSRSAVLSSKKKYYANWPKRNYELVPGTLKITPASKGNRKVTFEFNYKLGNGDQVRVGRGFTDLSLETQSGRYVVSRENGQIIKRTK